MRKNLVMLRVGPDSIHREWLDGPDPRSWDLHLVPYAPVGEETGDVVVGEVVTGPKWSGIREALHRWDGWRDYDYIWFPDDDIRTTQGVVDEMFRVAAAVGLDLFAPTLDAGSYYAHFDMMRNRSFYGRKVGFVEIMVPGFSRSALESVLPTLDLSETGWGLGLDSVWPKILDYSNIGMLDGLTVTHTRPIGQRRGDELARRMLDESDAILAKYDCAQVHTTFGVFGADLQPIEMTSERLVVELVKGWQYLIDQDPRILPWIVDHQRQHARWRPYPVEGTPEVRPDGR